MSIVTHRLIVLNEVMESKWLEKEHSEENLRVITATKHVQRWLIPTHQPNFDTRT